MLFRSVVAILSGILFAQGKLTALTPIGVVTNIQIVIVVSSNLNSAVAELSVTPTPQQVRVVSQTVVADFTFIIKILARDVTAMQATPAFPDAVAGPIVEALRDFVAVHQALLSTVIGKHSVFAQFGLTAPIAAVLRSLEAGIDSFAYAMIALIPTREDAVTNDKKSLDSSVGNTIKLYLRFCIPSPLYPTLPPICLIL